MNEISSEDQEKRNQKPETRDFRKKRREQLSLYAPLFIWIGVILLLGSGQGSMNRTSLIIRPILEFLFPTAPEETLQLYHGYVRKLAHFAEYCVLGFLAARAFLGSRFRPGVWKIAAVVGLSVAISATDEFLQSFNPERTASIYDVVLDVSSAVFAIFIYVWLRRRHASAESR